MRRMKLNRWVMMDNRKSLKMMRNWIHQQSLKCKFCMKKRRKFVNSDKKKPKSNRFSFELSLLMSSTITINNWERTLKLTVTLNFKIWVMMSRFMSKSPKKRRKFMLIMILNDWKKIFKKSTKPERRLLRKNKAWSEKRERPESKEERTGIIIKKKGLNHEDLDQRTNKSNNKTMRPKKQQILSLITRLNLTIHWLSLTMMITMFQTKMSQNITKMIKLIQMKSLMVNCLMMMLTQFQSQWQTWKKEENLLKKLSWKKKRNWKSQL